MAGIALLAGWTWRAPRAAIRVPILMYHLVGPHQPSDHGYTLALTVSTAQFRAEMDWLHRDGFHAISLQTLYDALEHGAPLPSKPVAITFDDGYRDVLWNAAPILYQLHMPATAFVITGRISGRDSSFLTWPELRLLERRGFTIGSHTVHHLELTLLSREEAMYELIASRQALQHHLHRKVWWFAYPAGRFDATAVALVARAGYRLALTTRPGAVQRVPLLLHRFEVLDTTGVRGLAALVGSR
ncbi:MAG TPA: polysaccharide deacetylase family protein [Gaiellaceae bacterium]|nr:polysaccharide deacetylase family protein [Gaiellaceae bacterium]